MVKIRLIALLLLCSTALVAQAQRFVAEFDPSAGILPTPINLLFTGSVDGTLNIPNTDGVATIDALNALDGFSTVAPLAATFSQAVAAQSLQAGDTVRVFEVTLINPFLQPETTRPFAVTEVVTELTADDFAVALAPDQTTVVITPLKPLKAKTGYMVVLTDGIQASSNGTAAFPDLTYIFSRYRKKPLVDAAGNSQFKLLSDAEAQTLESLRRVVVSQEDAAAAAGVRRGRIVLSWSFMTQSIDDVLQQVHANTTSQPLALQASGLSTADLGFGLPGLADIYAGGLPVPYFLEAPTLIPAVVLMTHWQGVNGSELTRYNPMPVATQQLTIPVLASIPNMMEKPATGWPVVIFQHGITRNRTDLFAVADALALVGFAAVAIDSPLHGITDTASPFFSDLGERTFNVDLVDNTTGAPGADGQIDASGQHFINLNSLLTSRDNLRQGAADLFQLNASLPSADIDGDGDADFDPNRIHFWGYSLGGIVGTPYLAIEKTAVTAAILTVTGGGVAKLVTNSASLGPVIAAGLAAAGIEPGTAAFESFVNAFQQAIDSSDPVNYAVAVADAHPVYMAEVLDDQVIPSSAVNAPLSGTEPLARIMRLQALDSTTQNELGIRGLVRFVEGSHGSPLSPADSPAVTQQIQTQAAVFADSDGTLLPVTNADVVSPAL